VDGLKKIVRSEMAMMPEPDLRDYTFIFHFAPGISQGDGMEHLNSSLIIIQGELSGTGLAEALETAAHEFFHLWNVKRLRPAGLGPFDYTREQYTRSLWFAEGVTAYYAYLHLLRSGVWSRQQFLEHLAEEIRGLELEPGRLLMSAESSSFHAWFYDRSPQMQETNFANTTISYYNKGAVLGMLLDLEIRARTGGQKSLDDVLLAMYRKFYAAPAADYYGPGQGYKSEDILQAVNAVAGSDFTTFFERYVRGTEPLPHAPTLASAGLQLRVSTSADSAPSLGVLTQRVDRGLQIVAVWPGRAADRGGLSRDDILLAVDELSLATAELKDRLKIYPPGAEVPFTVERHGRQERISVIVDPPIPYQYSIEVLPGATAQQLSVRNGWLGPER
jgi:predicted metalloprotease with PDZ domain